MKSSTLGVWVAWSLAAIFYFYQYALRSAPSVMMPQLSSAFHLSTTAVASIIGLFYYGYAAFSLAAGTLIDRLGAKTVVPAGALLTAIGALLFASHSLSAVNIGRFLQGAGGVFALVGAVYIATRSLPASRAATLIGATQMFGMSGGAAGQFAVGPMISGGISRQAVWIAMGLAGLILAAALVFVIPSGTIAKRHEGWLTGPLNGLGVVFVNPQSILCGLIAGLLFIPTTIFDMVWGIRFLQEAHGLGYSEAVIRSATIPLGWIIGCPLLGLLSDRLSRRKPVLSGGAAVLLACMIWILYGTPDYFPRYVLGLITGLSSGAAMLAYTVIQEANPPQYSGTAIGVINLLNFSFSALMGEVLAVIMRTVSASQPVDLEHYRTTFQPLVYGVALAMILTFALKETGMAGRATHMKTAEAA